MEGIVFVYIFRAISFAGHSNECSQLADEASYSDLLSRYFTFVKKIFVTFVPLKITADSLGRHALGRHNSNFKLPLGF